MLFMLVKIMNLHILVHKVIYSSFYKYAVSGSTSMHGNRGWLSQQIRILLTLLS